MKKSSVIVMALIFVASIFVINFFGLKMKMTNPTQYVSNIEVYASGGEKDFYYEDKVYKIKLNYEEGIQYQIKWKVLPENADITDVKFSYDENSPFGMVTDFGAVTFFMPGALTVYIKSVDGSDLKVTINIIAI